ncbi:hypothetical protein ACQ4M3_39760 [Leptolyngbya sp. AN03gr2]|uniref:hypothetical protein n=1 Tax=unclassified Leptolyngbya TaxID=2650499 RepID=UPI003D3207F8
MNLIENRYYLIRIYPAQLLVQYKRPHYWTVGEEITARFRVFQDATRKFNGCPIPESRINDWIVELADVAKFRLFIPETQLIDQTLISLGAKPENSDTPGVYHLQNRLWQWDQQAPIPKNRGRICTFIKIEATGNDHSE